MSWRVMVEWKFMSPALRVASGTIKLEEFEGCDAMKLPVRSFEWNVKIEDNMYSQKGHIPNLSETGKDLIESVTRSYYDGVVLRKRSFQWLFGNKVLEPEDEDYVI